MNDEQTRTRFESLLLPLMNDAYNLARWLMKNQEDAEDMVQESFLRAYRFFASFHEGTNCRAWFLRIVRNTCYTALGARDVKQKKVPLDSEADEIEDTSPLPSVNLCKKATVEAVREAIAALPVDFREAVVLRELEGLSYKEISEVSGVPLGTVMSRLARGRHQLYLLLSDRKQHSGRNTAAESFTKDGYNVSHWERDGFAFWAVSDVNVEDLRAFAGLEMQQS